MKFFKVEQPDVALVCAKDKEACREAYMDVVAETGNKRLSLAACHEIKFGQMLRETSEILNTATNQPLGLNESANQIFAAVFQQQATVFWKTETRQ